MNENQPNPVRFSVRDVSWLTIALAVLAVGTFLAISRPDMQYAIPMGGGVVMESAGTQAVPPMAGGVPGRDSNSYAPGYPYPYPNPDVPITDTREFLKVYYNASIYSRDVQALTRRVETTVRGYDGRIDQESSSQKYGYVSFAVPQSKYDAFRAELEGMVDGRFLSVNISSQNLLPQKVSIEEQQKQADIALSNYQITRTKILSAHTSAVASLEAKINAPDTSASDRTLLQEALINENTSYTKQLQNIDANISYTKDWQKAIQTQDQTFLNNVATVTGTVSIQWINLWDMAQLYLPGYWIPGIFAFLSIVSFLADRRRFRASLH